MNGYLLSVVSTILLCAVLTAILPEGKTSGMIKGIAKLACLLAIVAPIPQFLQMYKPRDETAGSKNDENFFNESVIQTDKSFIQYYSERRVELAERALEAEIEEKFDCQTTVDIVWEYYSEDALAVYDDVEIFITKIKIHGNDWNEEAKMCIVEYVSKHYCSEVLIE